MGCHKVTCVLMSRWTGVKRHHGGSQAPYRRSSLGTARPEREREGPQAELTMEQKECAGGVCGGAGQGQGVAIHAAVKAKCKLLAHVDGRDAVHTHVVRFHW